MFATRECRNKLRFKDHTKSKAKNQQRMTAESDIYEKVDGNTEYQELTEVNTAEKNIYDELK